MGFETRREEKKAPKVFSFRSTKSRKVRGKEREVIPPPQPKNFGRPLRPNKVFYLKYGREPQIARSAGFDTRRREKKAPKVFSFRSTKSRKKRRKI